MLGHGGNKDVPPNTVPNVTHHSRGAEGALRGVMQPATHTHVLLLPVLTKRTPLAVVGKA